MFQVGRLLTTLHGKSEHTRTRGKFGKFCKSPSARTVAGRTCSWNSGATLLSLESGRRLISCEGRGQAGASHCGLSPRQCLCRTRPERTCLSRRTRHHPTAMEVSTPTMANPSTKSERLTRMRLSPAIPALAAALGLVWCEGCLSLGSVSCSAPLNQP